ncbi:copper resistance protein B [Sneathiella aquimaris]|uniref:copper resistance protein B n=1 Tax=Sneathiella aquimaris TaxID=2599305 RepID=UPI00146B928D|nr:copper resistance protein B [Sneathiella aquimaris]
MIRFLLTPALNAFFVFLFVIGLARAEEPYYGVQLETLEFRASDDGDTLLVWDGDAFYGNDSLKIRWESNGEYDLEKDILEAATNQVTLQTPIADFWDLKGGVRIDSPQGPDRLFGVIGVVGLAPQWFEVDADLYLSEKGDVSMSLDIEYELLLTNSLILTPSAELSGAFSSDREINSGSGFNRAELGVRLSYDVWDHALSPYVGVVYERTFGQTADWAKEEGEKAGAWQFVLGTKFMF